MPTVSHDMHGCAPTICLHQIMHSRPHVTHDIMFCVPRHTCVTHDISIYMRSDNHYYISWVCLNKTWEHIVGYEYYVLGNQTTIHDNRLSPTICNCYHDMCMLPKMYAICIHDMWVSPRHLEYAPTICICLPRHVITIPKTYV